MYTPSYYTYSPHTSERASGNLSTGKRISTSSPPEALLQVSIINDAAWVGYELSEALRKRGVDVRYLPRRRTIYGKTLGAVVNTLKARGLLHVNYALQDAYLTHLIHGRIDVLHTHGSDVRSAMKTKMWGWMVRRNLKKAVKVLVSTPDLLRFVEPVREDVKYLPNPVDTARFTPLDSPVGEASCLYTRHWYESLPEDLVGALRRRDVPIYEVSSVSYSYFEMHKVYPRYSIFIDRFTIPSFSKACLEAMSCGLATIDYRHRGYFEERVEFLLDPSYRVEEGQANRRYIIEHHDKFKVCGELLEIYEEISR